MSLVEVMVTIAVVGVMSAGALAAYHRVKEGSERGIAQELVNNLNESLSRYSQVAWEFNVARNNGSTDEELAILRSLQWRDPDESKALHGSPFMNPYWDPAVSSDNLDYRMRWNGNVFELLEPGTNGSGLAVDFQGNSDQGTAVTFPPGYQPIGPSS